MTTDCKACNNNSYEFSENDFAKNLVILLPKYPELANIFEAWPSLPEAVKAGIMAMVQASSK